MVSYHHFQVGSCQWGDCDVAYCPRHTAKMGYCQVCKMNGDAQAGQVRDAVRGRAPRYKQSKQVRPNPDVAPHLQPPSSSSSSSSPSPSSTSSHHHIMIIITSKFATPSEQYVDWGNNINFIFMRGQNSPPPLNNMLTGVITSTLSS